MATTPAAPKGRSFDRSIVEGPIIGAVWKIAWPTVLQNVIGGMQGIIDHAMVGRFVGFSGNAAVGVALPAKPTYRPTIAWSTIPCIPPMMFCSTVGQAIFHTAPMIGPSTIERSKDLPFGAVEVAAMTANDRPGRGQRQARSTTTCWTMRT